MNNAVTPWQSPEIAMVMSIMNCMVVNVEQNNIVRVESDNNEE